MSRQSSLFLESIIAFLLPYFGAPGVDGGEARIEIIETLGSYATRTRVEMLQAAQIIALGMTTLDVLFEAKTAEMSQSMRLRYRGCANGLNRSTLNTEKALDKRLANDLPATAESMPEPADDLPDAELPAAIAQVAAAIDIHRNRLCAHPASVANKLTAPAPRPMTVEERSTQLWAGAMVDVLKEMGLPNGPVPGG
jgi:hypothetical protein